MYGRARSPHRAAARSESKPYLCAPGALVVDKSRVSSPENKGIPGCINCHFPQCSRGVGRLLLARFMQLMGQLCQLNFRLSHYLK